MTATVRTIEPTQITTFEEVTWTKSYADYPATLWQLNYYFRGPGIGFNAAWGTEVTADDDDFAITVPASKTDNVTVAGIYHWQAWLTEIADSTNKILIGEGRTKITTRFDPDTTAAVEMRTPNEIALDTINAALYAFATSDVLKYTISTPAGTRTVERTDKTQLLKMRDTFATLVANERARERSRKGGPVMQSVQIVMRDE